MAHDRLCQESRQLPMNQGSCWVLDKTDTQKTLQTIPTYTLNNRVEINNGSATISQDWLDNSPRECTGYQESAFSWTPLPTTLIPGQTIKITFGGKLQRPPKCTAGACSIYFLVSGKELAHNDRWPADSTYDWKVPDTSNYCFTQRSDGRKFQSPLVATFDMVGPGGKGKFIYSYKCQESAACP
jgi:hypothetical protein